MSKIVNTLTPGLGAYLKYVRKFYWLKGSYPTRTLVSSYQKEGTDLYNVWYGQKALLINQCLYLDLKHSQDPNMASASLLLLCFFRNTSLLSFHVANADGYHHRVNTRGSWDSTQQLIALTCWEGGREPTSHIASLPTAAEGFLSKSPTNVKAHSRSVSGHKGPREVILVNGLNSQGSLWFPVWTPLCSSILSRLQNMSSARVTQQWTALLYCQSHVLCIVFLTLLLYCLYLYNKCINTSMQLADPVWITKCVSPLIKTRS